MVSSTLHTCLAALWLAAVGLTASAEAQSFDSPKLPKLTPPTGQPMPELVVSYLQGGADDCAAAAAAAQIAGSGSFFVNSTLATTNLYNRDVWFVWTASADGTVFMGLCGTTPADTLLFAYPYNGGACPVQGAPSLAQNDDSCGLQSVISFSAVSGTSYYIAAASFQGSTSGYTAQLLVQETGASVDADECGGAQGIIGAGPHSYDNSLTTTSFAGVCSMENDQWFAWTASLTGTATVSTCGGAAPGSGTDTVVAVYAGVGYIGVLPTGNLIACNDDSGAQGCGLGSVASFATTVGERYLIRLGRFPGAASVFGTFTIAESGVYAPADTCATARVVTGEAPIPFDNTNAVSDIVGSSCSPIGNDEWFRWTAPRSDMVTVSACDGLAAGSGTDTVLAVYLGAGCPSAAPIVCNDDNGCAPGNATSKVSFYATCGQTYMIRLGRYLNTAPSRGVFTILGDLGSFAPGCDAPAPGHAYCFGTSGCPCGNNGAPGNGCGNSINPSGAHLTGRGVASLSADTLVLEASGMPNSSCLYFQGTTQSSTAFGDGLRCAAGSVIRLGSKFNSSGDSRYPAAGDVSVSVRGVVTAASTRTYQAWYRNATAFCTASTFNLTNGYAVLWRP
jgi:hypothetical protein